jgi:hypothetical protein
MTTPSTLHATTQWNSGTKSKPLQTSQNGNWQTNSDIALMKQEEEVLSKHLL